MIGAGSGTRSHDRPAGAGAGAAGQLRAARKELARLERQVGKLEQREAALHEQLALHATDYAKLAELDRELKSVQAERARTEEAWLTLADELPDQS